MSDAKWLPEWAANYFQNAANIEPDAPADFSIRDDPNVTALFQIADDLDFGAAHETNAEEIRLIARHFRRVCFTLDELVANEMAGAPPPICVGLPRPAFALIQGGRQ